jgi:starch phosphorylase
VKRIHEYKRQLLNILGVIYRYQVLKKMTPQQRQLAVPRVVIFGGKAAPAYVAAKATIKLICSVGEVINRDQDIGDLLKLVYIPNYNVSLAEVIVPASDISQHISTAGMEASGTSNMKFAMNGGLILGTMDGANIEMAQETGPENMFIFGLRANEIEAARHHRPPIDERLHDVLKSIWANNFADERTTNTYFVPLLQKIAEGSDYYLISRDFASYVDANNLVDEVWRNKSRWRRMCLMTIAGMGKFSSDRTIAEYAAEIWGVKPARVPEMNKDDVVFHT